MYYHVLSELFTTITRSFHILIIFSETTGPNGTKLYRNGVFEVLYKKALFGFDLAKNITTMGFSMKFVIFTSFFLSDVQIRPILTF